MSQADSQDWKNSGVLPDDCFRYPRVTWATWAGGKHDGGWLQFLQLFQREFVVAHNFRLAAEPAEIPREVVDETVVIVDDENQSYCTAAGD